MSKVSRFLLFFFVVFVVFFVPLSVASQRSDIESQITALKKNPLLSSSFAVEWCVIVQVDSLNQEYFHLLSQEQGGGMVNKACDASSFNGIIVKFHSPQAFSRFVADPKTVILAGANVDYYVYPSQFVLQGGKIICSDAFKERYCASARELLSKDQLSSVALSCCAKNTPFSSLLDIDFTNHYALIAVIVVLFALIGVLFTLKKVHIVSPELRQYVQAARSNAVSDEQIKKNLLSVGWKEHDITNALKKR